MAGQLNAKGCRLSQLHFLILLCVLRVYWPGRCYASVTAAR